MKKIGVLIYRETLEEALFKLKGTANTSYMFIVDDDKVELFNLDEPTEKDEE